jgi:CheY-like chemotaxis protein
MIRKTEPTSMFGGLAGLQSPAAAGLFFIGRRNPLEIIAEDFARIIFRAGRASWIKSSLILLMAGLWCIPLHGATNHNHGATNGFETPPPQVGSIQWQNIQRLGKERQELYRRRVFVPGAVATNVPRLNGGNFATSPKVLAAATQPPSAASRIPKILFFTAAFVFAGILVVRKFAPHILVDLNQRFNPWALEPATERGLPAEVRAEEEAFAKFLSTFRVGPVASPRADLLEKNDPVKEFYARAAKLLGTQRTLLQDIVRESGGPARQKTLQNLRSGMSSLKGEAGFPETLPVWQVASALEGLLKQLTEKTGNVTPSTLRAVAGGVDLLDDLCVPGLKPDLLTDRPLKFLVVDDDLISRQAMSLALKKAFGQPDLAVDGETALAQAGQQAYDVIFLDVQLPGMDGFELCEKIRDTDPNRTTPVVFVTGQSDFDARAKSALSGGNDLMGKPFLIFEITVKALTLALQGRLVQKTLQKIEPSKDKLDSLMAVTESPRPVPSSTIAMPPLLSTPATTETDDFTNAFLARASTHLGPLRELCQKILQTPDEETRQNMLADGFLRINSLISRNGSGVVHPAYQISAALEGLFKKMLQDPKHSTSSMLATAAAAVDLLGDLCVPGLKADLATNPPVHMLVVDDDLVARRVIVGALQTVFARPESVENGEAALALAVERPFDVIFLDVQMPGMDGFEVCSKIRDTVPNRATPVVFVTGHSDFETRARMSRIGGNDLMGKPFLTSEITVKALTFALRGRLDQLKTQPNLVSASLMLRKPPSERKKG